MGGGPSQFAPAPVGQVVRPIPAAAQTVPMNVNTGMPLIQRPMGSTWNSSPLSAVPALGNSITSGISNIGQASTRIFPFFQGVSDHVDTIQAKKDHDKWKMGCDKKKYLKFRKFTEFRDFCDGQVDDWKKYAEFKNLWEERKSEDDDELTREYTRWQRSHHPEEVGLWLEWCAWCGIKHELKEQRNNGDSAKKLWREYKDFHRETEGQNFAQYYYSYHWKNYANQHNKDWKDRRAFWNWMDRNKIKKNQMETYNRGWRRQYDDKDYKHWYWYQKNGGRKYFDSWFSDEDSDRDYSDREERSR